ncbi:adaptin N terminal region-domain-containing protein [Mucor mucedo]|uniref:adaptin N terminal region-domain-containing protein n=1 Tax=Mucor mucedo TaxID=29922 RepID=UPI002220FC93|nr:adaptin N terminal region-domain-containing protein [Mucor mucedo]KAI7890136.1 adaptin N terminal region-domain-containing protein [Mucor mucedo]
MEVSDYINSAKTFAEKAAKLSQKMSQGLVDNARELGFPGSESGAQYFDTSEEKMRNIKRQLDSKNDREKLDGLKRLIAMISKGRDVSEFFPDVVKNVVSQNIEIRKLVYIFLLRYAEQEPDLALLSINSFQKDLSDKNQIIRAMALRVMSGIRVPVISPIVLLGIKKCITDPSPYVRKTAAHAIPKCYSLDSSQKESLVEVIATLLKDRSNIVIGSTIMAFNEVCPNRFDLIHPCFRKLCSLLGDCDEWGQMSILGVLIRYGRNQFLNPNPNGEDESRVQPKKQIIANNKSFYSSSDDSDKSDTDEVEIDHVVELDVDHELLLKSCIPLLQSRNSGVVLAVAKLFYYLSPATEAEKIAKPLVRLLRSHREQSYVVLSNIATMSLKRPYLFESSFQHFYTQSSEPVFIRDTKLDILTTIATEANIHTLLTELQQYVKSPNKDFVAATIQAIARCATTVPTASDKCLRLLMKLLRSRNELVVAESVLVLTRLLQVPNDERSKSVIALVKLLETLQVPMARANILWLVGQYAETLPKVGPDVLRQAVKNFVKEDNITKLQILTLSAKLICLNPMHEVLNLLNQYVLNLARYDTDYDVRDRARFLRALTIPNGGEGKAGLIQLKEHLKEILLSNKEPPVIESEVQSAADYNIGSLSLLAHQPLPGYEPLPDFPEEQPDASTRDVEEMEGWSGSRTVVMESGFGSESFDNKYRNSRFSGAGGSTALSNIEAMGSSSMYSPSSSTMKKKGNDYDLDAFYDESSEEEESSSEEEESSSEEESDYSDSSSEEEEEEEDEKSHRK